MVQVAGALWTAAGLILLVVGVRLLSGVGSRRVAVVAAVAIVLGAAKGWFVLRAVADRNIRRIENLPGPGAVWQIYLPGGWAFIAAMMLLGMTLRRLNGHYPTPWGPQALGSVDLAVGVALLTGASRYLTRQTHIAEA